MKGKKPAVLLATLGLLALPLDAQRRGVDLMIVNARLVTMDEFAVDVQDEVTVPFIKRLKNDSPSSWKARKN